MAIVAAVLNPAATAHLPHLLAFARVVGRAFAAAGILALGKYSPRALGAWRPAISWYHGRCRAERFLAILMVFIAACYVASALGAATDADSLNYNLTVPMDCLLHGGAYLRTAWIDSRLTALSKMMNMLRAACRRNGTPVVLKGLDC